MAGYIANRRVVIDGTVYNQGDEIPSSELMPFYFKNLVRRGHVLRTEQDVDTEDVQSLIDASINSLIDTAPEALNTLNELAAAVNDDPNFSTTVLAHITSDGSDHTFIDQDVTSGSAPVFDGSNFTNLPASGATDIDGLSDASNDASNNIYLGATAPGSLAGGTDSFAASGDGTALNALTTGTDNFAVGTDALGAVTTGSNNIAIGDQAGAGTGVGNASNNIYIGRWAAKSVTAGGDGITVLGSLALDGAITCNYTTAIGYSAGGTSNNIQQSVLVGEYAGNGASSSYAILYTTAIGNNALRQARYGYNVAVGHDAGRNLTGTTVNDGSHNTFIGFTAGSTLTSGADNTIIGHDADTDGATRSDTVVIGSGITSGSEDGAIAIGASTVPGNIIRVESGVLTVGGSTVGISGPVSSTDNALVRWDGTGGDTVQNSGVTVDDSGNLTIPGVSMTVDSAGHAYLNADAASGGYTSGVRFQENGSTFWFAEKLTSGSSRNFRIQNDSSQGMTLAYSGGAATFTSDVTVGGDLAVDKTAGSSVLRLDVDNATYSNLIRMSEAGSNRWEILKKTTSRDLGFYSYGAGDYALTLAYADGDATFAADVTVGGVVSVDDTTDTSSGTTGSIHTDGGLGVAKKIYAGTSITAGTDLLAPSGTITVGGSALIGTASRYTWGNGSTQPGIYQGSGSPESVVSANTGSLYLNSSGGAGTTLYVKESGTGNTGWVAK